MAAIHQIRDRQGPPQSRSSLAASLARDMTSMLSLGLLLVCIHYFATPFFRGFQCNDETIRYPYKESTVSSGLCYLLGSGLNILLILIIEYVNLVASNKNRQAAAGHEMVAGRETGDADHTKVYLQNVYCRLVVWLFGAISSELITDITKVTAGRLRPHFIDVCKPVVAAEAGRMNFSDYCRQTRDPYEYILDYSCSGAPSMQRDARLSFLSGHSSYSAYSATFAVFYIQTALDLSRAGLFKPLLQVLLASAAFYTGLSRVADYKHHWQDVLAGLLLGTSIASLVSLYLWAPLHRAYAKHLKSLGQSQRPESGEELNQFSY